MSIENVSKYVRCSYASRTRSGLEAYVGPVTKVILCLLEVLTVGVVLTCPRHSVGVFSMLDETALGHVGSLHLMPRVRHWFPIT